MADNQLNRKELEELLRLSNLLEKNLSALDLENLNRSGNAAKTLLNSLRREADEFTRDISSAAEGFRKVVEEINNSNVGVKEVNKSFNKLTSIVDKIQYHQKGISKLNEKDVEKLQQQAKQEKERLTIAANLLKDKKAELELNSRNNADTIIANSRYISNLENQSGKTKATYRLLRQLRDENRKLSSDQEKNNKNLDKTIAAQENIRGIITDQDFHYNAMMSSLDVINKNLSDTQKLLGLGGVAIEGMNTALNKLGFGGLANQLGLDEAKEKMEETAEAIRLAGGDVDSFSNKFKVLKSGMSSIGSSLKANLTDPLVVTSFLVDQIIDAFKSVDSAIGDMAKGLDISYNEAANLRMELTDIANFSGDAAVNTKGLQESLMAVSQTLGVNARLNSEDLVTFTKLREQAGYTNEELFSMQRITTVTGGSLEKNAKTFLGTVGKLNAQNKLAINAKQLFKDIANVSDAIKLSVGGTVEQIAEAAFKAKQFGINLQQADQISESLLNFESSLANELSAELITGKDLNFERARLLAINGDIAGASAEILKQVGGTAEFTKMNRIQQEAIAKSVGMTREDLAKSLVDREMSAKLGAKEGQSAQDRYNELVKSYGVEKANAMLGDEALARQFQQQSVQEIFNQSIEKLKEIFFSLVEPLMPVLDVFADIFGFVGPIVGVIGTIVKYTVQWGKYLLLAVGAFKTLQFLGDIEYRRTVLTNVAKKTGLITDKQAVVQAKITSMLGKDYIADETKKNLIKEKGLLATISENIQKRIGLTLDKEALLGKTKGLLLSIKDFAMEKASLAFKYTKNILEASYNAIKKIGSTITNKEFIMEKASLAFKYTRNILEAGYNMLKRIGSAIAKSELLKNIGTAAMTAFTNLAKIPVVGIPLGIAAAASVAALGYKFMKGDDVMSEGGYGNRTLLTPKGSIALNNEDTVIAGTNLGGRGNNNPIPQQDNSVLIAELRAMRQEQSRANSKPTIVENSMNGTRFGTSVAMNTYKIQ